MAETIDKCMFYHPATVGEARVLQDKIDYFLDIGDNSGLTLHLLMAGPCCCGFQGGSAQGWQTFAIPRNDSTQAVACDRPTSTKVDVKNH